MPLWITVIATEPLEWVPVFSRTARAGPVPVELFTRKVLAVPVVMDASGEPQSIQVPFVL